MNYRLLLPILLVTLAVACTERTANESGDDSTVKATAQGKTSEAEKISTAGAAATAATEQGDEPADGIDGAVTTDAASSEPAADTPPPGISFVGQIEMVPPGSRHPVEEVDPATLEREFAGVGDVRIGPLDEPATADVIEPGRYLLTIIIRLSTGRFMKEQRACRLDLDHEDVTILLENSGADPILGTLEGSEFLSEPREGQGTYGLEGRVVGPGKIRGMVIPGPEDHPTVGIVEGRWGLDKLPLPEKNA